MRPLGYLKGNRSTSLAVNQRPAVTGIVGNAATISFADTGQSTSEYRVPLRNSTGDVILAGGAVAHYVPLAISSLPPACNAGDTALVNNWTGTVGVCSSNSGGGNSVIAACGASNTWYCG